APPRLTQECDPGIRSDVERSKLGHTIGHGPQRFCGGISAANDQPSGTTLRQLDVNRSGAIRMECNVRRKWRGCRAKRAVLHRRDRVSGVPVDRVQRRHRLNAAAFLAADDYLRLAVSIEI